jgi:putative CocE/NonD family hydrolase
MRHFMTGRSFTTIENQWITLKDGTRLAARIWMPDNAGNDPVPAVFEFLPYRKRDGTSPRDESTYPVFAAAGIAGVRVDIRGSGESDGIIDGEYTPLELANACELIDWIAAQPWSNGAVGMMGISWGGFNCLQVAALRPAPLKAVISIASTVDRYNDDIHYKNGAHLSAQLSWAATMLAYQSRSPDPELTGNRWREMWQDRLDNEPFFMEEWLQHQRRDEFWKHGSICENFDDVEIPSLVIAGWADGYRSTPIKAVEGMPNRSKAIIGPWVHKYPHFAWPKPRADFHGEAIRWWNRWLRGEQNGVEDLPQVRAYIMDAVKPALRRDYDPGFWVAKDRWTSPEADVLTVGSDGVLGKGQGGNGAALLHSPLDTGTSSGEWFTLKPDAEMAGDQRGDDAGSLVVETAVLTEAVDYLGMPKLKLTLAADAPLANLCARIVDVHPDGSALRVTFGVLNLAHRRSSEHPEVLTPGEATEIEMTLDAMGYRFAPGHRIRLSLSSSYWPIMLPSPHDATLTIDTASIALEMPKLGAAERIEMKEPENPDPLPDYIEQLPSATRRSVTRELSTGKTFYRVHEDTGRYEHPDTGLATRELREEEWSITAGDPLSMTGEASWVCDMFREGWHARTVSSTKMTCTAENWLISAVVKAFDGEEQFFEKTFEKVIPRDMM